ncbi:MAG: PorV/PorQ family protein [Saprospiraceae bacterium]
MNKYFYLILSFVFLALHTTTVQAGNPDRQGEAGAYELLMNPWAKSAGLHTMGTSMITGVEAMRLNVAGLSRINSSEFVIGHARYLEGTDIKMNAFGLAQRIGKNGAIGVSLMALDFGEIPVTTTDQPEGTGGTFSPSFFNLGLSYAHTFENKVSVGLTLRAISESIADLNAFGFAVDAGVQYVTGPKDQFKFGISLRNIGTEMKFAGEGLSTQLAPPSGDGGDQLTYNVRVSGFELPSVLNVGVSYDFLLNAKNRLTAIGNFTANSFSRDQIGGGLEYAFNEMFMLRGGYKYDFGQNEAEASVYTGLSGGLSVVVPFKKGSASKVAIDYAYRATNPWGGTHNFAVRLMF